MKQKVSVIIPTCNRRELLKNTLSSFNNQTYTNYQIVVIDDGSIHNISQVITAMNTTCPLSYYYISHRGRAGARNAGI
ncbi:MAG: glycosyltransferase family A protein, partial [Spirochaetota bacterium]